jgi:hypothetical protein
MSQVLHYQDDLFIINSMARTLADAANLAVDPEVLGDIIPVMVRATDTAFRRIKEMVIEKPHLSQRLELVKLLADIAGLLADSLSKLVAADSSLTLSLSNSADVITRMANAYRTSYLELREMLHLSLEDVPVDQNLVSGDELSELLRE